MFTEPIRDKEQLRAMADYWLNLQNYRNYLLIVLGVCTALRIGDLLKLRDEDVYDFESKKFRSHIIVVEQKTGKIKKIAISRQAKHALRLWFPHSRSGFLFENNRKKNPSPINRTQAWRIVKAAAIEAKVDGCIACHSLRKTFGYFAHSTGVMPGLIMDLYNHSSFEITKRYLGISQDDRDRVYLGVDFF